MEDAKITGITPAVLTFNGMLVAWPPTILRPTIFLEYWTGILLSASFKTTTKTTIAKRTTAISNTATAIVAKDWPNIKR